MTGHLYHAYGHCCILCGINLVPDFPDEFDERAASCPGGPGTNIRAISHIIAERKLAKLMQYDRPFGYPSI